MYLTCYPYIENLPPRPYVLRPPSKVPLISIGSFSVWVPLDAGMGRLARLVRLKKFMGDDFAGPAETATAKATMAAATEAFMSIVGLAKIGKVENLSD
jgi:hypothetical protein